MKKINFWKHYPKTKRKKISVSRVTLSNQKKINLRKFGKNYFDGTRAVGYGGYHYHQKYFKKIEKKMKDYYQLTNKSKILDVGCAKGFMMYDFKKILPKAKIYGIDISKYCKQNAKKEVKRNIKIASCDQIPFDTNYFDLVISISTIHNLSKRGVEKSLREIKRVSKKDSFIRVNAYKTKIEKKKFEEWNIVAKTILSEKEWLNLFKKTNYNGDYDWFKV